MEDAWQHLHLRLVPKSLRTDRKSMRGSVSHEETCRGAHTARNPVDNDGRRVYNVARTLIVATEVHAQAQAIDVTMHVRRQPSALNIRIEPT
jgi:hypothetical protein